MEIQAFTAQMTLEDYTRDKVLRLAVERSFEIIGEAMRRIRDEAPDVASRIAQATRIIGFRNVLIHGYDIIKNDDVWDTIHSDLPKLLAEVEALIASA